MEVLRRILKTKSDGTAAGRIYCVV